MGLAGDPQMVGFGGKSHQHMDDLGVPPFWEISKLIDGDAVETTHLKRYPGIPIYGNQRIMVQQL